MFQTSPVFEVTEGMLKFARFPKAYFGLTVEGILDPVLKEREQKVLSAILQMLQTGAGLFVTGNFRGGKTAFATMLLLSALPYGASCCFVRNYEIFQDWLNPDFVKTTNGSLLERIRFCDLVVVDDMGRTLYNECKDRMEFLLRYRFEEQKTTIITSNLSYIDLETKYGSGVTTILQRYCGTPFVIDSDCFAANTRGILDNLGV